MWRHSKPSMPRTVRIFCGLITVTLVLKLCEYYTLTHKTSPQDQELDILSGATVPNDSGLWKIIWTAPIWRIWESISRMFVANPKTTRGVSEFGKRFSCPRIRNLTVVPEERHVFQPVEKGSKKIVVFSAFFDDRFRIIRIIGLACEEKQLYCQLMYSGHDDEVVVTGAMANILPERYDRRCWTTYIMCPLPDNRIPITVSVVSDTCDHPQNTLKVLNTEAVDYTKVDGFQVCSGPLHSNFSDVNRLIENIEVNRLFGATQFTFYNHSASRGLGKVFKYYSDKGLVNLIQWPVPLDTNYDYIRGEIHYFAQMASQNDCLYRNSQKAKYVVVTDMDEFAVPRSHKDWASLFKSLERPGGEPSSFLFQNTFFHVESKNDPILPQGSREEKLNILTLLKTSRCQTARSGRRSSKYIARIREIVTLAVHNVWEVIPGANPERVVQPSEGLLHHYRKNIESFTKGLIEYFILSRPPYQIDRYMHIFRAQLSDNVEKVKKDLGLL